jgi:hypothetical protein
LDGGKEEEYYLYVYLFSSLLFRQLGLFFHLLHLSFNYPCWGYPTSMGAGAGRSGNSTNATFPEKSNKRINEVESAEIFIFIFLFQ